MNREVTHHYRDPLDSVWVSVLRKMDFSMERSDEVFASVHDGVLRIGSPSTLDSDDCIAQMIFHELCHSMVQGRENMSLPDWGLDNESAADDLSEKACLRLQAYLLTPYGLRWVLAPTTDYRSFYDQHAHHPLGGNGHDVELARRALTRIDEPPWSPFVREGLEATAAIAAIAHRFEPASTSLWSRYEVDPDST